MKRGFAAAMMLLVLGACSESPTQPPADLVPRFDLASGSSATWYFEGEVTYVYGGTQAGMGDIITGTVTFTTRSLDQTPDPCLSYLTTTTSFQYTVGGNHYEWSSPGAALAFMDCYYNVNGPRFQLNATAPTAYYALDLYNPQDLAEFPLDPPTLVEPPSGQWYSMFFMWDGSSTTSNNYRAKLTVLERVWPDPPSKAACKNDGWKQYGFTNQGLCIKFVETGVDTR